jgi:hypothetical protein
MNLTDFILTLTRQLDTTEVTNFTSITGENQSVLATGITIPTSEIVTIQTREIMDALSSESMNVAKISAATAPVMLCVIVLSVKYVLAIVIMMIAVIAGIVARMVNVTSIETMTILINVASAEARIVAESLTETIGSHVKDTPPALVQSIDGRTTMIAAF